MELICWFCDQPAAAIGYGFAVCEGRDPDWNPNWGEVRDCAERARDLRPDES